MWFEIAARVSTPCTAAPGLNLVEAVQRAPLRPAPFDHIVMENIFPAGVYRQMQDQFPAAEHFHPLHHRDAMRPDGTSTRLRLYLYPETLWRLPPAQRRIWRMVATALASPALETAFKQKFRRALEDRFHMMAERIPLYPVPILVRDLPGYRIGIHADSLSKAITVQFYLPRDDAQAHLGTLFHSTRRGDGTEPPVAMPFLPSSGYAFPVRRKESWHSAPRSSPADAERRSIMLTYYTDQGLENRRKRRTQRIGILLGIYPRG